MEWPILKRRCWFWEFRKLAKELGAPIRWRPYSPDMVGRVTPSGITFYHPVVEGRMVGHELTHWKRQEILGDVLGALTSLSRNIGKI